jgi:hypothetical protein
VCGKDGVGICGETQWRCDDHWFDDDYNEPLTRQADKDCSVEGVVETKDTL